jgi:hypothetical protein
MGIKSTAGPSQGQVRRLSQDGYADSYELYLDARI